MRLLTLNTILVLTISFGINCNQQNVDYSTDLDLKSLADSASYVVGFQNGSRLQTLGFDDVAFEKYAAGFLAGIAQENSKIPDNELQPMFVRFNEYINDRMKTVNQLESEKFLSENLTKEGVIETESGLQYKVIREGEGETPTPENTVVVMYEGRLIDGTIFDSSYDSNEPATFRLNQVIRGWIEGIQLMNVGSEFEFYIPANLGYGDNPRPGGVIQPGDALIFKVELLEIQ